MLNSPSYRYKISVFDGGDVRRNLRANAPTRVLIAPVPNATLLKGLLCLPTALALPTVDKGDFGTSPIYGQLSDKTLLASLPNWGAQ
jgi:hypothetical protein